MQRFFTIFQLKELFINSLNSIYSNEEVISIFNILLSHRLKMTKTDLILQSNSTIDVTNIINDLERLKKCEPIQYIIESTVFFDLNFIVTPSVLIPRQETEELVLKIIQDHKTSKEKLRILDIGTGSGIIPITLTNHFQNCSVFATDFSSEALIIARQNAKNNQVEIEFIHHDILTDSDKLLPLDLDIIVSNPPYIPKSCSNQMHENVVNFEPQSALFVPEEDPLIFYKQIATIATIHLKKNGKLYFETFESYHPQIVEYLINLGYSNVISLQDINNKPRFIVAEYFVSLP